MGDIHTLLRIRCLVIIVHDIKVGRYTGILRYSRYLVDTGMAVLVLTPYRYTVIGSIYRYHSNH